MGGTSGNTTMRRGASLARPHLVIIANGRVETVPLPATGELVLGRGAECDVRIDDRSMSRRHALIRIGPPLTVEDLGSANGTRLRDAALAPDQPVPVAGGEVVELGSVMVVVNASALRTQEAEAEQLPQTSGLRRTTPVVADPTMQRLYRLVESIAGSDLNVLVVGETGVGKELIAEALHRGSRRAKHPLVRLSCAAFPETMLESELFGHERGAFTGAHAAKPGLLETAAGGTVFLDEIGELPLALQAKLLRALEEGRVRRLGAVKAKPLDVRFVAATNRDLEAEVARGAFRADLYFRIAGVTLAVPPLRDRRADIEPLARSFLAGAGRRAPTLSRPAIDALESAAWPGNVRELRNVIARAALLAGGGTIEPEHLEIRTRAPTGTPEPPPTAVRELRASVDAAARDHILAVLSRCGGNQTEAAAQLGISRRTLSKRLDDLDIPRPRKR